MNVMGAILTKCNNSPTINRFRRILNKQQMKGTFTFTDGASNQTNLTEISNSKAKGMVEPSFKNFIGEPRKSLIQKEIVKRILVDSSIKVNITRIFMDNSILTEEKITENKNHDYLRFSQLNNHLNKQQMNLFTYLRRAITALKQSLNWQFLEQFKFFLSVVIGTAPDTDVIVNSTKSYHGILSSLSGFKMFSNRLFKRPLMRSWLGTLFLTLFTALGMFAQEGGPTSRPDVSIEKAISTQSPLLGQDVIYTIKVRNEGTVKATGVELTDVLPDGVRFKSVNVGGVGTSTNTTVSGVTKVIWNIGEVPATGTDYTMTVVATVIKRGLFFTTAEITKEVEADLDSTPNNNIAGEDDQDATCFSIEDFFYARDEFKIGLPVGYTDINWTIKVGNGSAVAITSATKGVSLNAAKDTLTISAISAYTEFAFTAKQKNCPVNGCCPAKFIPGPFGSIGDFVFTDANRDGIQDAGDTKLLGIKVQLYKADGTTFLEEVITDENGKYLFDSLQTGSYKVKFILPSGPTFSPKGIGAAETDSDAGLDGFSGVINIDVEKTGNDKDNVNIDAGIIGNLGSIGNFVFRDDNQNGIQDAGEPGIGGVRVNLYRGFAFQTSMRTDAKGTYIFGGLSSGIYQVEVEAPIQSKLTKQNQGTDDAKDSDVGANGKSQIINLDVTKLVTDTLRNNSQVDAGIIPLGSIGDYAFNDNNGNGIQDAGDTKLPGIKVTLTDKDGNIITSTVTDADGSYEFIVSTGDYFVIFDKPTASTFSPTGAATSAIDSDVDVNGKSSMITIDASKPAGDVARHNTTIDAGLIPNKGTIGDFVFVDTNGDNKQNAGETGLSGVTVELYEATGTTRLQTTTTNGTGRYLFSDLGSGSYKVKFVLPSGRTFTTPNVGTTDVDSDAGTNGFSGIILIDVTKPLGDIGRNNLTIDAGIKSDCNVNPGTLTTTVPNLCLPSAGSVVLTAATGTSPTVSTGYSLRYVLTKGSDLVIQQVSNAPTFVVTSTGEYRIHALVFDGNSTSNNFLDLSVIVLGITKGADLVGIINQKKLCAALDVTGIKFNVNSTPQAPVFAGTTVCPGEKVTLGNTGPIVAGISYAWFTSATATTPFARTQSISVSPEVTTTYYVESTSATPNACPSERGSVTVTVNPKPENPVAQSSLANDCTKNLQTVNLANAITSSPAGSTIEWHLANDITSAIITNTTAVGAGTYYAFAKSTAGCYSAGIPVTVTITPCICQNPAAVSVSQIASVCGNKSAVVQLNATIGGGATSGSWTSNGTGTYDNATSLNAKYTPSAADVTAGSVEFTFTTNDPDGPDNKCSAASAKTILSFKAIPAAPTGLRSEPVICLGDNNKLFSVSQGNTIKWYETATNNTPLGTATDDGFVVTPSAEGTYTYYAEATTPEGCVSERSSISFIVRKCPTDLEVVKTVYSPDLITTPEYLLGQTLTYSINAQNIGEANATEVKVTDLLPEGVTFVSAIPSGQYNNITGVWTIGNLNKMSNAVLLIQVKSNKIGTITNTATITGSNEDPTKLANNTSSAVIKVVDMADLSLTKTVNKSVVNVGDEIEYTLAVLNSGPNTATNVEIQDKLPAGLTYVSSSTLTENGGVLTGLAASIAKGATASFTFKAKVTSPNKITNLAEVTKSDQKDPDSTPANNLIKPDEDDNNKVEINATTGCNIEKPTIACGCTERTICLGGEVTLTATGCEGSTFIWSNGGTTSSITVSPKTNQTYTVFCQKDNCKSESSNAVEVKVIVIDSPLLSASPSKICAGESTTLTARGCKGVVEWQTSPKQTGSSITVTPLVSETYKAFCKEFECVSALASVDVIVIPTPKAPIIVSEKVEICPGETVQLIAMNCNGQVRWSNGQETTTITVFPMVTTSYTATCSVNGCVSNASTPYVLTVRPVSVPTIKTTDLTICAGNSATLTAEGCSGIVTWYYDGITSTGATIIVKPTSTTTYEATCSTVSCTSAKSSPVTVRVVNQAPPIVSSGTSTICAGSSLELSAAGCDGTVTWSDGQKGTVITVRPQVSTSYTATCTVGTCVSTNSISRNITVSNFAKPTITSDRLAVCAGNSITLTANGCNGTVKWSDGVTGTPRTVTPTADVKYTATCESATCKSDVSNELAIKVNNASDAPVISSPKNEICAGESVILSAAGCTGTIKWSDGSTGTTITVKPSTNTIYSATCTTNTCESPKSNEKTITVNPVVLLNLTTSASISTMCAGVETTLSLAGCSGIITWTGGLTGASIKVKPIETTTYTATCSGVACAEDASATVKVTVLPAATMPNITPTNAQICAGGEVTLTANNCNGTLLWSSGQTTASITVKPAVTTIYSVKCTVAGCGEEKTSEPVTVNVVTPDAPIVTSVPASVCAGGTVVLTATGCTAGTTVQWSNGKTGVTLTETINSTTVYSAVCKQENCSSPESNKVTVTGLAIPNAPVANSVKIDRGTTVDLNKLVVSNLPTGATLVFKTGASPASSTVANPGAVGVGIYYASYVNVQGCVSPATIITVENKDGGTTSPTDADIQIVVSAENNIALDSTVKVTITVKNNGPATGRNIKVTATIPSGLTFVSSTSDLVRNGSLLNGTMDSLVSGGVKVYSWIGKITGTTTSVTVGATATSTSPDPNPNNNNGSNSSGNVVIAVPSTNLADIMVTITTDKTTYAVGDTVTTTIRVTNLGPMTANGIEMLSVIPATLTYVSQTGGLVKVGSILAARIVSLDKDGVVTYTYKAVLNAKSETVLAAGGTSTTKDPNPNNNNGTGTTGTTTINKGDVDPSFADVAITITADKARAKVGEDVSFILSLTNNGLATAKQVVLINPIPAGMTFVSSLTGQTLINGAISISLDSLQKGQVRTYAYVAKMNVDTEVTNIVSVSSLKDNIGPNNFSFVIINGDTTGTVVEKNEADLAILITADKQLIAKDNVVTFTVKITNNGPKVATNVVVDNLLPKFLTFQTGDPSRTGDTLRLVTASIPLGGTVTYSYTAKVDKDTIISNTARITKTSPIDPFLTNNVSTVVLVPASDTTYADLGVLIAADKPTYKVGDDVTYTVTLTNNGGGVAKNVQLCNPIPRGLTYVSGTGVIKAGDSVTIRVDTISKGRTRTFTYVTRATRSGTITNTVRICNSNKVDLITSNNVGISSIQVDTLERPQPTICNINLSMAILDTAKVSEGVYNVTYRIIARNVCKDTLKNVTLYSDLAKTFRTPAVYEIIGKPSTGVQTNLIPNDFFSQTDSSIVKMGSYMLPNAIDTIKYVVKVTLNANKGPFVSHVTMAGRTTGNENLKAKARETLRFDLPSTRIGLAKEVITIGLKNDSTTFWTVPYRIRIVNMGANTIAKLSVKDSLDAVFTAKGAVIIGTPSVIATPGLTVNKRYTGKGLFTDLLVPDSSSVLRGDTARIDLTVRVNVAGSTDLENIFNNVAIGVGKGTDSLSYRDVSTNGINPDTNGDKDPSNDNIATPVQLKTVIAPQLQVSIGVALAAVKDTIPLADGTCNVMLIMTAKNYGKEALTKVRLRTNLDNTIGKQSESWSLVGAPSVIRGNAKISTTFNGKTDSTITKSDSSFIAVGDSIVIAFMINIKKPLKDTIFTQAFAEAQSAVDTLKLTSDISTNGLQPDINGDGSPDEAEPTPIICGNAQTEPPIGTLLIPSGISPNGDNISETLVIKGYDKTTQKVDLIIFNRWGGVVYAEEDYESDGKVTGFRGLANRGVIALGKGEGLPDGTYFYSVTLKDRVTGEKVGEEKINSFTLLR